LLSAKTFLTLFSEHPRTCARRTYDQWGCSLTFSRMASDNSLLVGRPRVSSGSLPVARMCSHSFRLTWYLSIQNRRGYRRQPLRASACNRASFISSPLQKDGRRGLVLVTPFPTVVGCFQLAPDNADGGCYTNVLSPSAPPFLKSFVSLLRTMLTFFLRPRSPLFLCHIYHLLTPKF
jgi:hypothetical protein